MSEFNALLYNALNMVFGTEWSSLDDKQQHLVLDDLLSDPDLTISEYQRCIGYGNLAAYVKCLEVPARKQA